MGKKAKKKSDKKKKKEKHKKQSKSKSKKSKKKKDSSSDSDSSSDEDEWVEKPVLPILPTLKTGSDHESSSIDDDDTVGPEPKGLIRLTHQEFGKALLPGKVRPWLHSSPKENVFPGVVKSVSHATRSLRTKMLDTL